MLYANFSLAFFSLSFKILTPMKNFITIADYCTDSLTTQELRSALLGHLSAPLTSSVSFVASTPSTIHTAFLLKQILNTENRLGNANNLVIFINTDPRIQTNKGVKLAKGANFVVARMKDGAWVCGPNAGYSLSLVMHDIDRLYLYPGLDKGTQFRSRDLYMRVSALLMEEKQDEMELEEIRINDIPALSEFYVGHIDNYGNIKTTMPLSQMKGKHEFGEVVKVTIGNVTKEAYFVDNMFAKEPETLVIAPGSSGAKDDPYLEVVVWQHMPLQSGKKEFPTARPGDTLIVK
jgi:hypothetical protein